MFNVEELALIRQFMDARQDRRSVIAAMEAAEVDPAAQELMEDLLIRLRKISNADFDAIDFDAVLLD